MLTLRNCTLGIEFGSTRIKAVLVDDAASRSLRVTLPGGIGWKTVSGPTRWTKSGVVCRPPTPPWPPMCRPGTASR